ncbi:hypothetical protein DS031_03450 [Bacillus taeanensis]|uniref:NAD-dependent epimerase/dehydratase domain-containing protein n=2 Tax=Bacillus taeanensis TaxID=273032 RepID=A0A366Y4D8_9BACI|nr:hypothetical protein DS031_03450 [Bacillus taeanensis]
MRKVLVTGGLGFIGFHLCKRLLEEGIEVIAVDKCENPNRKLVQEEMLLSIGRNANFQSINKGFGDSLFSSILKNVDCVFHLAVPAISRSWDNFGKVIFSHLTETSQLITECKNKNTQVIYLSSIEVYGPRFGILTEETPLSPITKLGLLKTAEEALIFQKLENHMRNLCVLRVPTIYGPWQGQESTYHQLLLTQIRGKMDKVVEDSCREDVIYIKDLIDILWRAGNKEEVVGVYNVGSGEKNQWKKGIELISPAYLSSLSQPFFSVEVSIKKLKNQLNFSPSTSLQIGLKEQKEHIEKMMKFKKIYS